MHPRHGCSGLNPLQGGRSASDCPSRGLRRTSRRPAASCPGWRGIGPTRRADGARVSRPHPANPHRAHDWSHRTERILVPLDPLLHQCADLARMLRHWGCLGSYGFTHPDYSHPSGQSIAVLPRIRCASAQRILCLHRVSGSIRIPTTGRKGEFAGDLHPWDGRRPLWDIRATEMPSPHQPFPIASRGPIDTPRFARYHSYNRSFPAYSGQSVNAQ